LRMLCLTFLLKRNDPRATSGPTSTAVCNGLFKNGWIGGHAAYSIIFMESL
jgi:hypothetical protein